jgi:hypothetical protein
VEQVSPVTIVLNAVTFGAGRYVAMGDQGATITSADALSWTACDSPTTNTLIGVAYGNGQFVGVGGWSNQATLLYSADGLNWTNQPAAASYRPLYGVTFARGQFVAVGSSNASGRATILTSADGLNWTPQTPDASNHLYAVTFGNGNFVAVGNRALLTSSNGVDWVSPLTNVSPNLRAVTYAHGWYVAAGSPALYTSTNAVDWTLRLPFQTVSRNPIYCLTAGDDSVVAGGWSGQVLESASFHRAPPEVTVRLREGEGPLVSFTGPELRGYEIQSAASLPPAWQTWTTLTNLSSTTTLPDVSSTNVSVRFYRAKLVN